MIDRQPAGWSGGGWVGAGRPVLYVGRSRVVGVTYVERARGIKDYAGGRARGIKDDRLIDLDRAG